MSARSVQRRRSLRREAREDRIDLAIAEERLRAIDSGKAALIPWEEVKRQLGLQEAGL